MFVKQHVGSEECIIFHNSIDIIHMTLSHFNNNYLSVIINMVNLWFRVVCSFNTVFITAYVSSVFTLLVQQVGEVVA